MSDVHSNPTPAPTPAPTPSPAPTPAPVAATPTPSPAPAPSPTPAPAATPEPRKSLAEGGGGDPPAATVPANFPDNWRQLLAGEDKSLLTQLERFSDIGSLYKSFRELQTKVSSGQVRQPLPENATPEQIADFRKANNLPEKAEGYEIKLADGLVVGEADKPLVAKFQAFAHESLMDPATMNKSLSFYYKLQDEQRAARDTADDEFLTKSQEALTAEWGPQDYRKNMNMVGALVRSMPEGLKNILLAGRTNDGFLIGDHPEFNKWAAQLAREIDPAATVMPAGQTDMKSIDARIATIEGQMGNQSSDYWRGPKARGPNGQFLGETQMQIEYRDLVAAREKMKPRAA